jgi:hypothetical protein
MALPGWMAHALVSLAVLLASMGVGVLAAMWLHYPYP